MVVLLGRGAEEPGQAGLARYAVGRVTGVAEGPLEGLVVAGIGVGPGRAGAGLVVGAETLRHQGLTDLGDVVADGAVAIGQAIDGDLIAGRGAAGGRLGGVLPPPVDCPPGTIVMSMAPGSQ